VAQRDRAGVERRLTEAVGVVLLRDGVPGLGVNALAREAGVDKVLIYRYFGGLDELVLSWAGTADFWPPLDELLPPEDLARLGGDLPRFGRLLAERYAAALRARPATVALLAWEMAGDHPLLGVFEAAREAWGMELAARLAGIGPPRQMFTLMNLHAAAIHYLLVRSRRIAVFGGTRLDTPDGWAEIFDAVEASFRALTR
jgi:AcrR family transcriptional regulator